jgi:hypothetical protein
MRGQIRRNQKWNAGRPFSAEKVNNIQRRLTTHDELFETFGTAAIEGLDIEGSRAARWNFMEGKLHGGTQRRELSVIFDANLIVRDFLLRELQD